MKNTDKDFLCVHCGSGDASIVREGDDPRVKCNSCGGTYDASQSIAAQDQGAIPEGTVTEQGLQGSTLEKLRARGAEPTPPKVSPPTPATKEPNTTEAFSDAVDTVARTYVHIPRTPSYVFMTKNRKRHEFCTKKDLKKTTLSWEAKGVTYDVFELSAKKVEAKVHIE